MNFKPSAANSSTSVRIAAVLSGFRSPLSAFAFAAFSFAVPSPSAGTRPHSLNDSPRASARWRISTLWSFDPVKWCSAKTNWSAGTMRRSACNPSCRRTLALVSPWAVTSLTPGMAVNHATTGALSAAATRKSRSPIVSIPRRRLPAASARSTAGSARSPARIGAATSWASHQRCRLP